jgi:acyl-coenzyme A synthetase/AMP-(fatty) acid ligase
MIRSIRSGGPSPDGTFKVPTVIHVLDEIPQTPTGKVQRRRMAGFVAGSRE